MNKIDITHLENVLTYKEYIALFENLMAKGEVSTRGTYSGKEMLDYTAYNMRVMAQLDETTQLSEETLTKLLKIDKPVTWLVITEGWCGDAGQIVPVFEHMAQQNPNITHKIILRDEHLDIMDAFLTDEGRSIPKLIVLDENGHVLTSWGPRPKALHTIVLQQKMKLQAMPKEERKSYFNGVKKEVQAWYDADKTKSIQKEVLAVM
jgi:Thioredoxin